MAYDVSKSFLFLLFAGQPLQRIVCIMVAKLLWLQCDQTSCEHWHHMPKSRWFCRNSNYMNTHSLNCVAWKISVHYYLDMCCWPASWRRHQICRVTGPLCEECYRWPVTFPHKGRRRGVLMFSWMSAWINDRVNDRDGGNLRRHRAHYDVSVMNMRVPPGKLCWTLCIYLIRVFKLCYNYRVNKVSRCIQSAC